ncbi:hypothetical protein [Halarchaeum nitratireducens]|uniref:Uncharacterized protein n=1 Tax=Halarchaeum nitratireducens TaxID=489913 RepID=A0A830GGY8_9EURY|nr:hypothetical protein [Halarchaeum nitratireducens]GGN26910.1 hypothetical protein GCM10009021_31740 [Halarchaeum nitratireducens]
MTRRSKSEIERRLEDFDDTHAEATVEDVVSADIVQFAPREQPSTWRLDGTERVVPQSVRGDVMRIWLGGEPKNSSPPSELVRENGPEGT